MLRSAFTRWIILGGALLARVVACVWPKGQDSRTTEVVRPVSERERAALAWTEAVTTLDTREVPDAVFAQARAAFSERELTLPLHPALTAADVERVVSALGEALRRPSR